MLAGVIAWILGAGADVIALARRIGDALTQLWSTLTSFFAGIAQAAGHVAGGGLALGTSLVRFGIALALKLPYILFVYVPARIGSVVSQLTAWTLRIVQEAKDLATQYFNDLTSFVGRQVAALVADASAFKNWAISQLAGIINTLLWVQNRVVALLTNPDVLAEWLLAALWRVGTRWVEDNAAAIGRWFLGIAVRGTIAAAGMLEDIIVKII